MWEGGRSKRRFTDGSSINEQPRAVVQFEVVPASYFHKKVMRMLAVNDGQSIGSFSRLEKFRISAAGDCSRFQTEHSSEHDCLPPKIPRRHRHQPIDRKQFVTAARTSLLGIYKKAVRMKHKSPIS